MRNKGFLTLLFVHIFISISIGQNTLLQNDPDILFLRGKDLYQKKKYAAARSTLEEYVKGNGDELKKVEAEYYIAISAVNLYHKDGETRLDGFIARHPDHPKASEAYYEMGNFYFRDKKYTKAIKYLEKADASKMDRADELDARFKIAYSYFNLRKFEAAQKNFDMVKRTQSEYAAASYYYSGYISYRDENYDQALFDFRKAEADAEFKPVVPYMIINMYYRQKRYDDLIDYAESVIKSPVNNKDQIHVLLGDAYYLKEDYRNAGKYYSFRGKKPLGRDIQYRIAYTHYRNEEAESAINMFKGLALKNDSIGQFSGYYLGELYLDKGEKEPAAAAFLRAGQSEANLEIQEQSLFQYAKLAFDLEWYNETIHYLEKLELEGEQQQEADELLGVSYLNTSNFDLAFKHFESIDIQTPNTRKAYQRVAFLKASQLFNDGKFKEAVDHFNKSLEYPENSELVTRANYWLGESYFVGRKFEEARDYYIKVTSSGLTDYAQKARYGLGYSYYNLKEFDRARVQFKAYTDALATQGNKEFYADALIRLADCYYVAKEYSNALNYYEKALASGKTDRDYILFQKGVLLGIQNRTEEAQASLRNMARQFPRSRYVDDAMFQSSNLDFETGNYESAINGFTSLINRYPKSNFVPHALLKRGIANANFGKHELAIKDYQQVLQKYGTHSTANAALLGLQEALAILNRSEEFNSYLANYKEMNPDDKALASIEFESGKSLYFNQNYSSAVSSLEKYLQNYPENQFSNEARYYLADSYYRLANPENAKKYFLEVINSNSGNRINRSIQRVADLEKDNANYREAVKYYRMLLDRSGNKKEVFRSFEGLMHSFYRMNEFDSSAFYAQQIIDQGGVSTNAINEAQLYLGKSAYGNGDLATAQDEFLNTLNTAKDVNGAEAQYMVAKILHDEERFELSNETLFDLNKNFGSYEYWVGEAFLLIADNYLALDEDFQAQATLQSIVDNFPDPQVVSRAQEKLDEIIQQSTEELPEKDSTENYEIIDE